MANGSSRGPDLRITQRSVDDAVIVAVAGEVDMVTAPRMAVAVTAGLERVPGGPCILDLTEVTFMGSRGLATLLDAARLAQQRRQPLRIVVAANSAVIRLVEITTLDRVLPLYPNITEALGHPRP